LYVSTFGYTDTDLGLAVTDDDKRLESETTSTFYDTCYTVDVNDGLFKLLRFLYARGSSVIPTATTLSLTAALYRGV
jgi:hypothetical protein